MILHTSYTRRTSPVPTPERRTMHRLQSFVLALTACPILAIAAHAAENRAFVVTTDFSTGGLSAIDLTTRTVTPDVQSVFSDARARFFDGLIYVVNRFGQDNLQVIDPGLGYSTIHQFSTGNGSNPADVMVISPHKAFVTLYERPDLLVMDPTTGAYLDTVPLGGFADADGIPEMDHMARFGHRLFVSLQRLDRNAGFTPTAFSSVVVVDVDADTVVDANPGLPGVQAITLAAKNPVTAFSYDPVARMFYVGCAGAYGVLDGGITKLDPIALTSPGVAISEATLGGEVGDVEWHTATHGYAIVSDPVTFDASLVTWNPTLGTKLATLLTPGGFSLPGMALDDRDELYVCDNSFTTPGVHVFSVVTDLAIAGPLGTGLPPNDVLFDRTGADVTAEVVPGATTLSLGAPWPNPATETAVLRLGVTARTYATVEVFGVDGRRVRTLLDRNLDPGSLDLTWSLDNDAGRRVGAGLYFVRARVAGGTRVQRVSVLE